MKMSIEGALVGVGLAALGFAAGYNIALQNASRYRFLVDHEHMVAWRMDTRTGETSVCWGGSSREWSYMSEPGESTLGTLDEDDGG